MAQHYHQHDRQPAQYRTLIVLDNSHAARSDTLAARFELGPKGSPQAVRSPWSFQLEGALEYCRIAFDLFPTRAKVCVVAANDVDGLVPLNNWQWSAQSTTAIIQGGVAALGRAPPPAALFTLAQIIPLAVQFMQGSHTSGLLTDPPRHEPRQQSSSSSSYADAPVIHTRILIVTATAAAWNGFLPAPTQTPTLETNPSSTVVNDPIFTARLLVDTAIAQLAPSPAAQEWLAGLQFYIISCTSALPPVADPAKLLPGGVHGDSTPFLTYASSDSVGTLWIACPVLARIHFGLRTLRVMGAPGSRPSGSHEPLQDVNFYYAAENHAAESLLELQSRAPIPKSLTSSSSLHAWYFSMMLVSDLSTIPTTLLSNTLAAANSATGAGSEDSSAPSSSAPSPVAAAAAAAAAAPSADQDSKVDMRLHGFGRYGALTCDARHLEKSKVPRLSLPCSCVHAITPVTLGLQAVAGTIKYTATVTLLLIDSSTTHDGTFSIPSITHLVMNHNGSLFLHCVMPNALLADVAARPPPPSALAAARSFDRIMRNSLLVPAREAIGPDAPFSRLSQSLSARIDAAEETATTTALLERATRRVPRLENQTSLYSVLNNELGTLAQPLLEELLPTIVNSVPLTRTQVDEHIQRLFESFQLQSPGVTAIGLPLKTCRLFWLELREMAWALESPGARAIVESMDRRFQPVVLAEWNRLLQEERNDEESQAANSRGKRRREEDGTTTDSASKRARESLAGPNQSSSDAAEAGFATLDKYEAMSVRELHDMNTSDHNNAHQRFGASASHPTLAPAPLLPGPSLLAGPPVGIPAFQEKNYFSASSSGSGSSLLAADVPASSVLVPGSSSLVALLQANHRRANPQTFAPDRLFLQRS
ncbi:hypothetical protein CAOG_04901 [Capsaspora owczarzaki ATCC 30864]|uniref:Uncharacterized protein n=1 Tax=Capsaspora owczarzaki (strain ATCC 30864) TaxID=595528 RepID=A0A0D2WQZ6_CAPO3|nr:hypothetical protein CAOG_04901 [Capsaspora owczarzaki ATCC 30864]KJE94225.1 hypothetical protein, variant [Capsaspora owczarzaki ATCC 30864]|eukprot:XP_004347652.2 hypothetical protein CAOG_04901 [Capsaspora owczarzaki ATCC 30864]